MMNESDIIKKFTDLSYPRHRVYLMFFLLIKDLNSVIEREAQMEQFTLCLDNWGNPVAVNDMFEISQWDTLGVCIRLIARKFAPYPSFPGTNADELYRVLSKYLMKELQEREKYERVASTLWMLESEGNDRVNAEVQTGGLSRLFKPKLTLKNNDKDIAKIEYQENGTFKISLEMRADNNEMHLQDIAESLVNILSSPKAGE